LPLLLLADFVVAICFTITAVIFGLYFSKVIKTPLRAEYLRQLGQATSQSLDSDALPKISILIPAYNEETVIESKLRDVARMDYPLSKCEVILIDDSSTDHTRAIAERMFKELCLPGRIVCNSERTGVNGCYNAGLRESTGDLIATTDSDVMVDHDALLKGVKALAAFRDVGGVTARMAPMSPAHTTAVQIERSYRDFYDNSMFVAESAIHSTFPGYTNFLLARKTAFPIMPSYGSSDGNISLSIIRQGLRFICVPTILFYEPIAENLHEQVRQKTRRAARMIQSALANRDLLFSDKCGAFGDLVFPLRLLMMTVTPVLSLVGFVAILVIMVIMSVYWVVAAALFLFTLYAGSRLESSKLNLVWSLIVHQCYLMVGLFLSLKKGGVWNPIQRSSIEAKRE
jgi:cellulose synthase/poly-beta-1,6-N-acetylglucosamine synthase-like glycosyltransferase